LIALKSEELHFAHKKVSMSATRHQVLFVKRNEKGEITTWKGDSADGKLLKMLVENGMIDNQKPAEIRTSYPQFMKYSATTFRSALTNARKSFNNELYRRSSREGTLFFCSNQLFTQALSNYISSTCRTGYSRSSSVQVRRYEL
jgi:hypothetical protein